MEAEERKNHAYIGDGVYAEWDGYHVILRANDHRDTHCTDKIYLEPGVLERINLFYKHMTLNSQVPA